MKAKITKEKGYRLYIQGELHTFAKGDVVEGYAAQKALEDDAASEVKGKAKKAPENKSAGAAPENKAAD